MIEFDETKHTKKLREIRMQEEEDLAQRLSQQHDIPYVNLSLTQINTDALRLVEEETAKNANIAPFKFVGQRVAVATTTPTKEETVAALEKLRRAGHQPEVYMTSERGLKHAWNAYEEISFAKETERGLLDIANADVQKYAEEATSLDAIRELISERLGSKQRYEISHLLELFIAGALGSKASDIHIEPKEDHVLLRMRLDGVLQEVITFEHKIYNLLLSRIKLLSGLKINVKEDAQDGRFSIQFGDDDIEVRTSTVPGAYGESIVMRVLNPEAILVPFEELGIEKTLQEVIEKQITKPNGMLITTGPTGSGKTTTLYAFLRKIQSPESKTITIEDPVEYHLAGITQTQIEPEEGYTFSSGLRAALRQDPDVIMIGEIRDDETARTAVNAALTGHLVLSTLHTNTAAGAIPRLLDLEVNPKTLGSAMNAALAQRLVRRLCEACKHEDEPTQEEYNLITGLVNHMPEEKRPALDEPLRIWRASEEGCDECNNTGYKGRIGVFEAVIMDESVEKLLVENPSEREISRAAREQGIPTMAEDGIAKVLAGMTSLEELQRVVELSVPE